VSEKVFLIRCTTNTFRWRKWNSRGFSNPQFWAWAGNLDLIKTQARRVYDATWTTKDIHTLVQLAAWNMHAEIVGQSLSDLLFSVEFRGGHSEVSMALSMVLSIATEAGDVKVLRLLHQKVGRRLFGKDESSPDLNTSMHFAAKFGHVDVVKMLGREVGVRTEDQNRGGQTPMHWAAKYGHSTVIEVLCSLGANHSSRDDNGSVPMHYATGHGEVEAVKMLICKGASVTISNKLKRTPLHFAVMSGNQNVVELLEVLRGAGANIGVEDEQKRTPFDWAVSFGNDAAIEFFKREGFSRGSIEDPSREITGK
jgi:ankyrin repeat protein